MSGVLGRIRRPLCRRPALCKSDSMPVDPRLQQLWAAKEILAEVFRIDLMEVEEMIHSRREEGRGHGELKLWPEMLWVAEP